MAQKILAFYLFAAMTLTVFGVPTPFTALFSDDVSTGGVVGDCGSVLQTDGTYKYVCEDENTFIGYINSFFLNPLVIGAAGIGIVATAALGGGAIIPYLIFAPFVAYGLFFISFPTGIFNSIGMSVSDSPIAGLTPLVTGLWIIGSLYLGFALVSWLKGNE